MSEVFDKAVKEGLASLGEIPSPFEVARKLGLNIPTLEDIQNILSFVGPQADIQAMVEESSRVVPALKKGDISEALSSLGLAALAPFMIGIPGTTSGIKKGGLRLIQGGKKDPAKKGLSELGEEVPKKTEKQKYDEALREQQKGGNLSQLENDVKEMGFTDLDEYMITDGEVMVDSIIERSDLIKNKTTQELFRDIEFLRDYTDWNTDYMRSGRSMGPGPTSKKKLNIENFFLRAAAEIEKRMK